MSNKVTVTIRGQRELQALMDRLPALVTSAGGPTDRAVRAAGAIVRERARQLAPRSKRTGTKKKQSRKARSIWTKELATTIRSKVVKYPTTSVAIIGPKSPEGNAAHFMQEEPRKHVLWGKTTRIKRYRIARNWIVQAFDETKQKQHSAMLKSLRKDVDEHMRSG